jgi:hypothetical protein
MDDSGKKLASAPMLWRLNEIGLLEVRDEPGEPLERAPLKEILGEAARLGLWQPIRGVRGTVRSG